MPSVRSLASKSGGKLIFIHFRDVSGEASNFTETFINEGNLANKFEIVAALKENGFNSFIIDDHVPHMIDDTRWGHRGRAYATGYLQALVDVVNKVPALSSGSSVPA